MLAAIVVAGERSDRLGLGGILAAVCRGTLVGSLRFPIRFKDRSSLSLGRLDSSDIEGSDR